MTHLFTAHFRVRNYEINAQGELPNSTIQRLFQETAMQASADAGYGVEWYSKNKSVWVIHEMTLEHARPIRYLDELAITTWVSDIQRVRSHREYIARNAATGEIVARGRAFWAHLNRETLFPTRIPVDIFGFLAPNGERAVSHIKPRTFPPPQIPFADYRTTRRVYRYEADEMKHVNNAMYLDWLEEALSEAVQSKDERRLWVYRHDIEYARSAMPGDEVTIIVRLVGAGQSASAWNLEIVRGQESLVQDHIIALWVNDSGNPVRWNM